MKQSRTMRVTAEASRNGQGLVEFAIALTVLLIISFGVMDLARVFHTIVVVTNAAREGARYGTRHPNDLPGARNAALNEAQGAGLTLDLSNIAASCTDLNGNGWCDGGSPLIVTVNHTFNSVMGNLFAASPLTISRSAEMIVP